MESLNLRVMYRPLRIGWCVRKGDFAQLRQSLRLTHILWGGRFNPIIPVDDECLATNLIETFAVDTLCSIVDDDVIKKFTAQFDHLPWPSIHRSIIVPDPKGKNPFVTLLDIYHPLFRLHEEHVKNLPEPRIQARLYEWQPDDPLADVFLTTLGAYPSPEDIQIDYAAITKNLIKAETVSLKPNECVPTDLLTQFSPSNVTEHLLLNTRSYRHGWALPGLYVGDCSDFQDMVNYWNLRAAGIDVCFYDPSASRRLASLRDAWLEGLMGHLKLGKSGGYKLAAWAMSEDSFRKDAPHWKEAIRYVLTPNAWNGKNIAPVAPHFKEHSVLATVPDEDRPSVCFKLPEPPFLDGPFFMDQHFTVSVHPLLDLTNEQTTLTPPFIPEINEYLGRQCYFEYDKARVERGGLGIIITPPHDTLTLKALDVRELIHATLAAFGIKAEVSHAGRIASRLIQQMGGLQSCRVFKISGVRELIARYGPTQAFNKHGAVQTIGASPQTGKKDYRRYERLCLESRKGLSEWKPMDALLYLLKKRVFTVGLEFVCPQCELRYWKSIDDVRALAACPYCSGEFDATPQLLNSKCAFRRSGLFGRDDNQQGAIAVAVTLQQLHTALRRNILYTTGTNLSGSDAIVPSCETDLVIMHPGIEGKVEIVIGECKTQGPIEEKDVQNLVKVANALPDTRFDVFLLFSKLDEFSPEEIELCHSAQGEHRARVIMLSDRELEPYHLYELTEKDFRLNHSRPFSFREMADNTDNIFFNPLPR